MDPNSSLENICLGDDVIVISSDKVEGSGDWNSSEYQDTSISKGNKVVNVLSFYRIEMDEISERYIAPCFVKKRKMLVKKELIVALKGELYFVKFIINPVEDDFEPGVILGRSFLRLAQGVVDFGNGLLDFNFDDVPKSGEELPPFVCKIGKRNRNKKRSMENLNLFYQDIRPSSSTGRHLTQEEGAKAELAIMISQRYALLEEERHVIKTMAYNDKYKKILNEI
ncbi:hypothetical protein Tco_0272306 [Tanacetum coccineum]